MRPADLFDREREWHDLEHFVTSGLPGLRVAIVHGRRRMGKSYLLRRLAAATSGLYHMALEEEPAPSLRRLAASLTRDAGFPAGSLQLSDWEEGLRLALDRHRLVVLDELPYLLRQPAGAAIPSILQLLVDESRDSDTTSPRRLIVCGSALAVMTELLSGTKPLRGRAELDLRVGPFDYRTAAEFYRLSDPEVAFRLNAMVGGTPGYRDLLRNAAPTTVADLDELLAETVLNPSHALFDEAGYLLREDPRVTDRALYHSVLAAIAGGASTASQIAGVLGRPERSLAHPLTVMTTAGFVVREDDLLLQRRPTLRLADPIVRFHELVTAPRLAAFEERHAEAGWRDAQETVDSQILGPHFEHLCREWVRRFAAEDTTGGPVGEVGTTVVNDPAGRSRLELDVVALPLGQRRQAKHAEIQLLGEAKASGRARTGRDLARLDRAKALLVSRGVAAANARVLLFGRSGFDAELVAVARRRPEVELVDLDRLYGGE